MNGTPNNSHDSSSKFGMSSSVKRLSTNSISATGDHSARTR